MDVKTRVRPVLKQIKTATYVCNPKEKLLEYGVSLDDVIDCSLGINPYGCSPMVKNGITDIDWDRLSKYPDISYADLKRGIIEFWNDTTELKEDDVFFGSGAAGVLVNLNNIFIEKGSKVLGYSPQFSENVNIVSIFGGKYDFVPLNEKDGFSFDEEGFLNAVNASYDVIYIDNPNNPTGQIINLGAIEKILKKAAQFGIPVIIDEAYGDFMEKANSAIALCGDYDNLVVVRSFSKGLGLANIRLGYAIIKSDIKEYYNMVNIPPFVYSDILVNAALQALRDKAFLAESRRQIRMSKEKLILACKDRFFVSKTAMEVPIIVLGNPDKTVNLYDMLLKKGVITAAGAEFPGMGENYVRLRVPKQIDMVLERLDNFNSLF